MNAGKKSPRVLTARAKEFASLVATGTSNAEAWRRVFNHPNAKNQRAAERGSRLATDPRVVEEIARLRAKSEGKKLLSLNDRLAILAEIGQAKGKTPAMYNAKTRALDVYSKLAGDQAPQRIELSGPGGAPIESNVVASVTSLPIRGRIAALRAKRDQLRQPAGNPA